MRHRSSTFASAKFEPWEHVLLLRFRERLASNHQTGHFCWGQLHLLAFSVQARGRDKPNACLATLRLGREASKVTGQVYSVAGTKLAVWNQPEEVRAVYQAGGWTPESIAERLDSTIGQEKMGLLEKLEMYAKAAAAKQKPNA